MFPRGEWPANVSCRTKRNGRASCCGRLVMLCEINNYILRVRDLHLRRRIDQRVAWLRSEERFPSMPWAYREERRFVLSNPILKRGRVQTLANFPCCETTRGMLMHVRVRVCCVYVYFLFPFEVTGEPEVRRVVHALCDISDNFPNDFQRIFVDSVTIISISIVGCWGVKVTSAFSFFFFFLK